MAAASASSAPLTSAMPSASATPEMLAAFPLEVRPTCPTVLIPFEEQLYSLPVHKLDITTEFNVSTAYVRFTGKWKNIAIYKSDCMFVLPLEGTVTQVSIRVADRLYETVVLPKDEVSKIQQEQKIEDEQKGGGRPSSLLGSNPPVASAPTSAENKNSSQNPYEVYIPNLFRLPIPGVGSGEEVEISAIFMEPLFFSEGKYHFKMPLRFGANLIPDSKTIADVLTINCVINSVTPTTQWFSNTHQVRVKSNQYPRIELEVFDINSPPSKKKLGGVMESKETSSDQLIGADAEEPGGGEDDAEKPVEDVGETGDDVLASPTQSTDFKFAYSIASDTILTTIIKEEEPGVEDEGTFCLFVTPPSAKPTNRFSRNIYFLIDRSGSMTGPPFQEAVRALEFALKALRPEDYFNIVSFDHRRAHFSPQDLVPATAENLRKAVDWLKEYQPENGGTDIITPLHYAVEKLESKLDSVPVDSLPFVVLLTDGCVPNEREICQEVSKRCKRTRILTYGIGFYCNWYFLKMLAQIGRGFSDIVVYKERICAQMTQLLGMASQPVLTNVELSLPGVKSVELYPFPLPDLFMGAPLTVSGKYRGRFPDVVTLKGDLADQKTWQTQIHTRTSDVIPVNKVFLKQRLDLLTASAWLKESRELEEEIIDLSCRESMPSAYTAMVAFQTDDERKKQLDSMRNTSRTFRSSGQSAAAAGSSAAKSDEPGAPSKKKKWYRDPKKLAALAVGHAVVIGAAAYSFGDVGASLSNLPVIGAIGDAFSGDCCGCDCGDGCGDCDCGDCLSC